uniref:Uncharacterized protein n=1 Tax=Falco tinnunculus TaxID=100819 RepID=A0A8C4V5C9_FALTI
MESWLVLAFCILSVAAVGKLRERCELAAAVKHLGPNNFQGRSLGLCKSRGHVGRYLCSEKLHGSMLGHGSKVSSLDISAVAKSTLGATCESSSTCYSY